VAQSTHFADVDVVQALVEQANAVTAGENQ
jgi:hypothetical protein